MKINRSAWLVILTYIAVAAIRWRLASMPLERDEGEYAYMGQQMLQGIVPYGEAANMKWPGTYASYALIEAIFGQSDVAIRIGLIGVNAAAGALLYAWVKRLYDSRTAAWASVCFAVWSLSPSLLGIVGHATHFVSLCALGGILALTRARTEEKTGLFFFGGVLFGLATLMKQHGVLFLLPALMLAMHTQRRGWRVGIQRALILLLGACLPIALTFAWLWQQGVWEKFWFWTVDYARSYATSVPFSLARRNLEANTFNFVRDSALWGIALLGFYGLWRRRVPHRGQISAWLVVSFLMTVPGFFFRPHYFLPAIPFLSLLIAVFVREGEAILRENAVPASSFGHRVPSLLGLAALIVTLIFHRAVLFQFSPDAASRRIYRGEMFVETKALGLRLRSQMAPNARLAIFGSEPQIAFYARRRLASEFLYTYNMVELQPFAPQMQRLMASQIERAKPQVVVEMRSERSWIIWPGSDPFIFNWLKHYLKDFHLQSGVKTIDPATNKPNLLRTYWRQVAN